MPSLDCKLADCSQAAEFLASWLGRKGIMETPGELCRLGIETQSRSAVGQQRPILPWRKLLPRCKGLTLG